MQSWSIVVCGKRINVELWYFNTTKLKKRKEPSKPDNDLEPQNLVALGPWLKNILLGRLHQNLDIWETPSLS